MARLTKLRIDRFRNVAPGTELRFGPAFNVLLGKNATGKTTLLEIIAAVTHDDLSAFASEEAGFDFTWWLELEEHQLEIRAVRTLVAPPVDRAALGREEREFDDLLSMFMRIHGEDSWQIDVKGTRGTWRPLGEPEVEFDLRTGVTTKHALTRAVWGFRSKFLGAERPRSEPSVRAALGMHPLFFGAGRFDEALTCFDAIADLHFEITEEGRSNGVTYGPWVPEALVVLPSEAKAGNGLHFPFDKIGSLASVPAALGFSSAAAVPRLLSSSQEGAKTTTRYQGCDFRFRRADGSEVSHRLLSFGQKRLFAFLWYLALHDPSLRDTAGANLPIVADELLNGLHHDWIDLCFERLEGRQVFLSTQHPLLLDHIPIESAAGVRETFVRCALETVDGRERLSWRNLTEDEADRFFTAHQTGIQQVSEVLRTEGLW